MPFIGGRYYANVLAGHAIEAAREAALLALKQKIPGKAGVDQAGGKDAYSADGMITNRKKR